MSEKKIIRNSQGVINQLEATYTVYEEYVYDFDENKPMWFIKLGQYKEIYNPETGQTISIDFSRQF